MEWKTHARGTIDVGDVLETLRHYPDGYFDAALTDPPYGLKFMGKAWDKVVPGSDVWREVLRVVKPGAPLLAFGGTRTAHRLTVAIEDAELAVPGRRRPVAFEVRDALAWLYATGFPKSHDIAAAVAERDPAAAEAWDDYGTALKPAYEPITYAVRPLDGTFAENALAHGVAGLNIGGARLPFTSEADERRTRVKNLHGDRGTGPRAGVVFNPDHRARDNYDAEGRWPPNVFVDEAVAGMLGDRARFFYVAKPDRAERDAGLDELADRLRHRVNAGGLEHDPRWAPVVVKNDHATVKPIDLTRQLATLILPPPRAHQPRRLLVPFAGSGSEIIGAALAGWDEIVGIERDHDFATIAAARVDYWVVQAH